MRLRQILTTIEVTSAKRRKKGDRLPLVVPTMEEHKKNADTYKKIANHRRKRECVGVFRYLVMAACTNATAGLAAVAARIDSLKLKSTAQPSVSGECQLHGKYCELLNVANWARVEPAATAVSVNAHSRPVAGIDERLLFGGSLAYEKAHYWQAATQAGRETQRCAEH
jgi:hypothetical protein